MHAVNLADKFSRFYRNPRLLGEVNDFRFNDQEQLVFLLEVMPDELALELHGFHTLRMKFRDHEAIVHEGAFVIVPHGFEHMPVADEEVHIILSEPKTTLNTGNVTNERTVTQLERI